MQEDSLQKLSSDLHPPLSQHEAYVESDRCYFCHDAPCVTACPTGIDIPLFIRQINTANPRGAAKTIFNENIFGGMCARVCPTETLCEEVCVRTTAEERPVKIGELQRYATDTLMQTGRHPYKRGEQRKHSIGVVGAGPAGISCAHRLAMHGYAVTVYDALPKSGGLNEYGIASYKTPDNFAQREVDYILSIGGIDVQHEQSLGADFTIDSLKQKHDAVFLGIGLGDVNNPDLDGIELDQVEDAVAFIARLRQAANPADVTVGRKVVVIGGGMTAIDAAVQSKMLGAEDVTVVYRRTQQQMNASAFEQELAQTNGVLIKTQLQPTRVVATEGEVSGVEFEYTKIAEDGSIIDYGERVVLAADQVLLAVGQSLSTQASATGLTLAARRLKVDDQQRTSDPQVWAGGDCASNGDDLTVAAVQAGKVAAESIHASISA